MSSEIFINGRRVRLDPSDSKGKGGEADIYGIGDFYSDGRQIAAKVFKGPDHPDYLLPDGSPNIHEQQGASERLKIHQTKLRQFPRNLPPQIVRPMDLATDRTGKRIVGYTMELLGNYDLLVQFREKSFRQGGGIGPDLACKMLKDLHIAVSGTHAAGVVLGDFNDLNVMVSPSHDRVRVIDADSAQFGVFACRTFTQNFVDPRLCVPCPGGGPLLKGSYSPDSDWYAFLVMLMQTLLFLDGGPYGGVHKPKDRANRIPHAERWQKRITVFHPEVVYPRPAAPLQTLPDDLLHFMTETFVKDRRGPFPPRLLDMTWTACPCGTIHARKSCPSCRVAVPVTEPIVSRGHVKATTVFSVPNNPDIVILHAAFQDGELRFLYHDGSSYRRETGEVVISGPLDSRIKFRVRKDETLLGKDGTLVAFSRGSLVLKSQVDSYGALPLFDANAAHRYWVASGTLWKDKDVLGIHSSDSIGQVLANQTLFWVGPKFGFGFYRAGEMSVAFVFDAESQGIKDTVQIPIRGQLIDSTCAFSDGLCWFFHGSKEGSKIVNHCHAIRPDGTVVATASADRGSEPWLDNLRGKLAAGDSLFVPTDDGILKYGISNGAIVQTGSFPDTERFVDAGTFLFPGRQGIHAVGKSEIKLLQLT